MALLPRIPLPRTPVNSPYDSAPEFAYWHHALVLLVSTTKEEERQMPQLVEMDRHVSLFEQMDEQVGSVVLINTFTVEPEEAEQLQEAWASDAAFMKQQPGFISTQLHRGIGGSSVFVNYAVWESTELYKRHLTILISSPKHRSILLALWRLPPLQESCSAWDMRGLTYVIYPRRTSRIKLKIKMSNWINA